MSEEVKIAFAAPNPRLKEVLSPDENVAKLKEEVQHQRDALKPKNIDLLSNAEMALGKVLMPSEFIRLLKLAGPNLIIEPGGYKDAVAVRIQVIDDDPLSPTHGTYVKKYVSGFYVDRPLAEYSCFINDASGVPYREVRGWRTVLLMLISVGALRYQDVNRVFGEPEGQRNILWKQQTQERRV